MAAESVLHLGLLCSTVFQGMSAGQIWALRCSGSVVHHWDRRVERIFMAATTDSPSQIFSIPKIEFNADCIGNHLLFSAALFDNFSQQFSTLGAFDFLFHRSARLAGLLVPAPSRAKASLENVERFGAASRDLLWRECARLLNPRPRPLGQASLSRIPGSIPRRRRSGPQASRHLKLAGRAVYYPSSLQIVLADWVSFTSVDDTERLSEDGIQVRFSFWSRWLSRLRVSQAKIADHTNSAINSVMNSGRNVFRTIRSTFSAWNAASISGVRLPLSTTIRPAKAVPLTFRTKSRPFKHGI